MGNWSGNSKFLVTTGRLVRFAVRSLAQCMGVHLGPAHWGVVVASVLPNQILTVLGTAGPARVRLLVPDMGWAEARAGGS